MGTLKVICTDVDGILTPLYEYQEWMVEDYFTKLGKTVPEKKNPYMYDIRDIYGLSKIQRDRIWLQYFSHYCQKCEPRKEIFELLKYYQELGVKVPIVSARAYVMSRLFGQTVQKWFDEWIRMYGNGFVPDDIVWCPEKNSGPFKADACSQLNADVMLEDKPENFEPILEVCPVVSIITPYNGNFDQAENLYTEINVAGVARTIKRLDEGARR